MLYRCAEVTLASGHDYFILTDHSVERDVRYHSYVDVPPGGYFYGPYGPGYYDPFYDWYYESEVFGPVENERYRAYATIAVYSGTKPADNPNAYDARAVERRLKGYVLRPAGG